LCNLQEFFENRSIFRFMEPFAVWNLIKSVLSSPESLHANAQPAESATVKSSPEPPVGQGAESAETDSLQGKISPPSEPRLNACEAYFLRHEQLKNQRKR
jgi:hypothetical protein